MHHHHRTGGGSAQGLMGVPGAAHPQQPSSSSSVIPALPIQYMNNAPYIEAYDFPYCAEVSKYERLAKIGQGTFGEVFKARDKKNKNKIVALKKVLMDNEKEGFPITALREVKILQLLTHENIVNLIEICRSKATHFNRHKSTFFLVFDFAEHDLAGLLSNFNVKFSLGEIKKVMQQLLNGLYYIHSNKIIHRDMKAANVLITKHGVLKLADFGLARAISINKNGQPNRYTNRVVTLWYRPPELLLGERNYGSPVDLWGAGCIMAEMWTRSPIMQGNTEQHQLTLIAQLCGAITPEVWPGVEYLELYNKLEMPKNQKRRVRERLRPYVKDQAAVDLLDKLLCLCPRDRLDSNAALDHDFFWTDPMPEDLGKMLSQHSQSMFEFLAPRRLSGAQHRQGGGGAIPTHPQPGPPGGVAGGNLGVASAPSTSGGRHLHGGPPLTGSASTSGHHHHHHHHNQHHHHNHHNHHHGHSANRGRAHGPASTSGNASSDSSGYFERVF